MDKLRNLSIAAAVAFALAACAQNQSTPDDMGESTASTSGTSQSSTTESGSQTQTPSSSSDTSTSSTDTSTAQTTPDQSTSSTAGSTTTPDSSSSSSSTGTMSSDSSASSSTGTMSADSSTSAQGSTPADQSMSAGASAPVTVGLQVETPTGEPLGTVVEIVSDASGQPAFAVINAQDKTTAVPYTAAASMVQTDALVIDRSRLESAPTVAQGEWNQTTGTWATEANDYWGQGETRTATPGTGTEQTPESTTEDPESRNR
jgi:hypothetical protein